MRLLVLTSAFSLLATASQAGMVEIPTTSTNTLPLVRVADGCGPGFHLGPRGFCRPNGPRVVVVEPRPVVVEPRPVVVARPVVVERPVVVAQPVVVARPVPTCGLRVGPIAVRGVC